MAPRRDSSTTAPATPEDVISELRRSFDVLTDSQKRIAEVIVEDPEFVAFATIDKLAARLGVSPSTIVRFAYRLQFAGYPDLQERVREVLRVQLRGGDSETTPGQSATERLGDGVAGQSLRRDLENLQRTIRAISLDRIGAAVDLIADARRIYVTGAATSLSLAQYASVVLGRVRSDVLLIGPGEQAVGPLLDLVRDDVVLAFTFPPYAASTMRDVEAARAVEATVVAVTDSPVSPVGQVADVLLTAVASGIGTQNSLVAPMAVVNLLLNGVAGRLPDAVERYGRSAKLVKNWKLFLLGDDTA